MAEQKELFIDGQSAEDGLIVPTETPETESTASIIDVMADDVFVANMKKAAANSAQLVQHMRKILVSISYPGDWTDHDGTACLSSAGAERYFAHFPIKFSQMRTFKEEWSDEFGKAYRFLYTAQATLWGRVVQTEGKYSTRDKFHGVRNGAFRPIEDININEIQSAARHICIGNGVKTLLGLRGIPTEELKKIFSSLDKSPDYVKSVEYRKGAKGGRQAADESELKMRSDAMQMLTEMTGGDQNKIKVLIRKCSGFKGGNGKTQERDSVDLLSKKWLVTTFERIKIMYGEFAEATGKQSNSKG